MNILNNLPEFLRNDFTFFAMIVLGVIFAALVGTWLIREIRGRKPGRANAPGSPAGGEDASLSGIYRGAAGATRTMDNSPSGILGAVTRTAGRSSQPASTSIISGSSIQIGTDRDREQIEPELRQAGYYRPTALTEYRTVRALLVLMPLVIAAGIALFVEPARMPAVAIGGAIMAGLGYSIPRIYINYLGRVRRREIERGLPIALDMIVLGLVAGQNIMNSFQRVSHEIRRAFPILAEEMAIAYRQAELNTLGHALRVWADRTGVPEVYNLSVILVQSERQGADIANSLLEFAASHRVTLRQRADAQANRAAFWMLFPTIFCMWMPAAVLLAAPLYLEFDERRAKAHKALTPPGANPNDPIDKQFAPYPNRQGYRGNNALNNPP
jgi:pilus assembly protein TadC